MSQGVLRLCTLGGEHLLKCPKPLHPSRLFSGSFKLLNKEGKPLEAVKGVPYKNLTIGVPKEKWLNERRSNQLIDNERDILLT
jgi:H+-translocating NAD(P) transhydrogenase